MSAAGKLLGGVVSMLFQQIPRPIGSKISPANQSQRDVTIQSPARECRESSPVQGTAQPTRSQHFGQSVPEGRDNSEPGTGVPGIDSRLGDGTPNPFKTFGKPVPEGRDNPEPGT